MAMLRLACTLLFAYDRIGGAGPRPRRTPEGALVTPGAEKINGSRYRQWESTICVFGEPLPARVTDALDEILVRRVREGGHSVSA